MSDTDLPDPSSGIRLDPDAVVWSDAVGPSIDRPLVVLLHGRGSNERDLAGLVPYLPSGGVYASVRAPFPEGPGWSWFVRGVSGAPDRDAADEATDAVLGWLDTLPAARSVAIGGFSQGGVVSLELLRRAPERFAGFANLSGYVIGGHHDEDAALETLRRPVFWGTDLTDPVIPASAIARTGEWLPSHSRLTARRYPGLGHSIAREEIDDLGAFLTEVLELA